jgi:signal transduction histidine kinase
MKLSRFIIDNIEEILAEWESFAKTLEPSSRDMSVAELRDHGKQILEEIAQEIDVDENAKQRDEKSKGLAPDAANTNNAAGEHGTSRQETGFTLLQVISEYRAMRASVLRLWMPQIKQATEQTSNDTLRFNEAIDQALSKSAITFSEQTERTRDTFLAILGHDLRSPLATMAMAGDYLTRPELGTDGTLQIGARVKRSAATMTAMVHDLLEYARTQLGRGIPLALNLADMKDICQAAVEDASAAHTDCAFELKTSGELHGNFDGPRLQQVFSNLLNNAAQYRGKEHSVTIVAQSDPNAVMVQVKNRGPVIPPESLKAIFDPLVQLSVDAQQQGRPPTSLGLGLFIAREITVAHGGTITAESSEDSGTVFTVTLPRTQAAR